MPNDHDVENILQVSNYRLHEPVRHDELAIVYRATHLTLDRPVHVHLLRRSDWVSVSRFHLAARLAARLHHPHLLPVIDAGHDEMYGDYMVTPMLDARPLSDLLEAQRPFEPLMVLRIATQLAGAIDYLHSQGICHRDIHPANVLVTPDGVTYLTGLGLAASPDTPDLSSVDQADYLTPYSPPEQQLDQNSGEPASDIYALGALLYHLFSGELPPEPGMEIPPLGAYDPLLRDVDTVLARMLDGSPQARYPSAGEAVAALRRALRPYLERVTDDMEESRWEPSAEWLENPLETVFGDLLNQEYLKRTHTRADMLHRADALRRLLNRWSNRGWFRRSSLGHIIELEHIVSYNIYYYELLTRYETRMPTAPRQRPLSEGEQEPSLPMPNIWDIPIPEQHEQEGKQFPLAALVTTPQRTVVWPHSQRFVSCPECRRTGMQACRRCQGTGKIITKSVFGKGKLLSASVPTMEPPELQACPDCRGSGTVACSYCLGKGQLVEEQCILWSQRTRVWNNTDDLEGLPKLAMRSPQTVVYDATIDPFEGRWHSVAPLNELLRRAIEVVDEHTRIVHANLCIRGVPMTEVDYRLNRIPLRLYIVGEDQKIIGSWHLLHLERCILVVLGVGIVLSIVIALLLTLL